MNTLHLISAAVLLVASATFSASAQTRPGAAPKQTPSPTQANTTAAVPATKMAFVDTTAFGDDKVGIKRYVNAVKSLEREFQPRQIEINNMQTRIKALADEISKLNATAVVDSRTIAAKQDEGERLQRDMKYKKDQADADVAKRYQEVVGPISSDIGKAIDKFAAQRGITLVLDVSKLAQAILTLSPAMDVTQAFINDYNNTHP
jgi:Skp family chaperone for outer membrane proteins